MTASRLQKLAPAGDNGTGPVAAEMTNEGFAVVTLDAPPDNRLTIDLVRALADTLESLDEDDRCRSVLLRANGRHFCAGASLDGASGNGLTGSSREHLYDHAIRLFATRKPIVAAVQGAAVGGGLGLALAADFRVGTPQTRLTANFALLGIHHGFGLTETLPDAIGRQAALDLLYIGREVRGDEARRLGLLDEIAAPDQLVAVAGDRAGRLAFGAPLAVESIRATMRSGLEARLRSAMAHEREEQRRLMATRDFQEGVASYRMREPDFKRR